MAVWWWTGLGQKRTLKTICTPVNSGLLGTSTEGQRAEVLALTKPRRSIGVEKTIDVRVSP